MSRLLIAIVLCFSLCLVAKAQVLKTPNLYVHVRDSITKVDLVEASVTVVSGRDTINKVTVPGELSRGHAQYFEPLADTIKISVSLSGYETYMGTVTINQAMGIVNVSNIYLKKKEGLVEALEQIDKTGVTEQQQKTGRNRKRRR